MNFVSVLVRGVRYVSVKFCTVFLLLVFSRSDRLGGGVECVIGH